MKKEGLVLNNVSFSFDKDSPPLFSDTSAHFEHRIIHFIRGRNGSGKSTLLRLLQGKIYNKEIAHGNLELEDRKYNLQDPKQLRLLLLQVALVKQNFDSMLVDSFTFKDNIRFVHMNRFPGIGMLPTKISVSNIIDHFSIPIDTPVKFLSGGQRQILVIIMMLQKPKKVLLLDEPTAALDEKNTQMVITFLRELCQLTNIIIIIVSHDKEIVDFYGKRGYWMLENKTLKFKKLENNNQVSSSS